MPRNPPAYNPESNGAIEKGVQDFNGQLRTIRLALETRLGVKIAVDHPIMEWAAQHAGFLLTTFSLGHDGKTPWERLGGRRWNRVMAEFGEQVLGKLARQRMSRKVRSKNTTVKRKMNARMVQGTWVGQILKTGENVIIAKSGKAVRVRTIKRLPFEQRWDAGLVTAITSTPRYPDPKNHEKEVEAKHDEEIIGEDGKETTTETGAPKQREYNRTAGPRPDDIRELRLTRRLFDKFGYSNDCDGCQAALAGEPQRKHSHVCRTRMYELIGADPVESPVLEKAIERMNAKPLRGQSMIQ
jgi:hypothetical protein